MAVCAIEIFACSTSACAGSAKASQTTAAEKKERALTLEYDGNSEHFEKVVS